MLYFGYNKSHEWAKTYSFMDALIGNIKSHEWAKTYSFMDALFWVPGLLEELDEDPLALSQVSRIKLRPIGLDESCD